MATELTYQQRLIRFEIAQDTIGMMMARRTSRIDEERRKPDPDAALIAQWEAEFAALFDELYDLKMSDEAAIERVLTEYCPLVKADFEGGLIAPA